MYSEPKLASRAPLFSTLTRCLNKKSSSPFLGIIHALSYKHRSLYMILPNAGIRVCASQKEKTSLGPVMRSLGVRPLKNDVKPSCFIMFDTILKPLSGFSKFLF